MFMYWSYYSRKMDFMLVWVYRVGSIIMVLLWFGSERVCIVFLCLGEIV